VLRIAVAVNINVAVAVPLVLLLLLLPILFRGRPHHIDLEDHHVIYHPCVHDLPQGGGLLANPFREIVFEPLLLLPLLPLIPLPVLVLFLQVQPVLLLLWAAANAVLLFLVLGGLG